MNLFFRRLAFLTASTALGLTAACTAPIDAEAEAEGAEETASASSSLSVSLTMSDVQRLRYVCDNALAATTPELVSAGSQGVRTTVEASTWRRVSCVTNGLDFTYVWERTLLGTPVRTTLNYSFDAQALTVNPGECAGVLRPSRAAGAAYTCDKANDRLRLWVEGDVNAPFFAHHPGCDSVGLSRSSACTAAAHRYCNARGYGGGMTQEVGPDGFGVGCFAAPLYRGASYDELRTHHGECRDPQSAACIAAIHRVCAASGHTGGLFQELGGAGGAIACFDGGYFQTNTGELPGCATNPSSGADCTASAHRFCAARGYAGGLVQETQLPALGVACFAGGYFGASLK